MFSCHATRSMVFAFACALALQWTTEACAHGVTLRIHHALSEDSPFQTRFLVPWKEKLERESDGHLRIQLYPAMRLGGDPSQLYDQAKDRTVDIVWTAVGYEAGRFPAFEVFNLPLGTQNAKASSRALWRYVQRHNVARTEFGGVRVLAVGVAPAAYDGDPKSGLPEPNLFVFVMNGDVYKSLPDELKGVISANSGAETSAWLGTIFDDSVVATHSGNGDSATDLMRAQQRVQGAVDRRIQELNRRGLDGRGLVDSARALLADSAN